MNYTWLVYSYFVYAVWTDYIRSVAIGSFARGESLGEQMNSPTLYGQTTFIQLQ